MGVPLNHPPIAGGPIYGSPRITKFKHMGLDGPIRDAIRGMEYGHFCTDVCFQAQTSKWFEGVFVCVCACSGNMQCKPILQ